MSIYGKWFSNCSFAMYLSLSLLLGCADNKNRAVQESHCGSASSGLDVTAVTSNLNGETCSRAIDVANTYLQSS